MANPTPTKLEDRGIYWRIYFDDGGTDEIPKDPALLDAAAVTADEQGKKDLAAKFRMYAANIRNRGVPVVITSPVVPIVLIGGAALIAVLLLFKKGKR